MGINSETDQDDTVSTGSATTKRKLVNMAAGDLSATSTEAVNGSQLFALQNSVITGSIGLVQQDATSGAITVGGDKAGTSVSFAGVDAAGAAINRTL
ncbi:hypothetical protein RZA67_01995, partial [Stenotrophomonas sp. C3(2023)]|nr:hypothetical protein [Stenotrophomonas sp. C3(2023)]